VIVSAIDRDLAMPQKICKNPYRLSEVWPGTMAQLYAHEIVVMKMLIGDYAMLFGDYEMAFGAGALRLLDRGGSCCDRPP
jgi:hypothetical protein